MVKQWMLNTHGDPIGTVQKLIHLIWQEAALDGMLVSMNGASSESTQPVILRDPAQLEKINPFKPLMTANGARFIPDIVYENPAGKMAALLRPCEMRAAIEMVKHNSFRIDDLLTISVDCLGTYPTSDYKWRAERKGSADQLNQEALHFARQGGIMAYRYRSACQLCTAPQARGAKINISVIGLPVRQHILITVRKDHTAQEYALEKMAATPAPESVVEQHELTLAKLIERRQRTQERVIAGLGEVLPADLDGLIDQFDECGSCQKCLESCPICYIEFPRPGEQHRYLRRDVMRWLISCAGCGMCEQACPKHQPLAAIFNHIRNQLAETLDYKPGISVEDPLPVH